VILCAAAAILAQGLAHLLPQQSPFISAVAGVVLLLPGFTLTVAMSELATQNYLAGTGRLTGAVILLFLMGAGLAIGTALSQAVWPLAVPWERDAVAGLGDLAGRGHPWRIPAGRIAGSPVVTAGFDWRMPAGLGCLFPDQRGAR